MNKYDFCLYLYIPGEVTDEIADTLIGAGCDDATLSVCEDEILLQFCREDKTLKTAVISAIKDVGNSNIGAKVMEVSIGEQNYFPTDFLD